MARLIIDYVALDIDAGIDPDGIAVLTLVFANRESIETGHVCKLRCREDPRQALLGADRFASRCFRHEVAERTSPARR